MGAIFGTITELEMYRAEGRQIIADLRRSDPRLDERIDTSELIARFNGFLEEPIPSDGYAMEELISTTAHLVTALNVVLESLLIGAGSIPRHDQ